MKKIKFLTLATIITLVFTSCSNEETLLSNDLNSKLLKSYKVKRDATGAYSIDYDLYDNAIVAKNTNSSLNEFSLYSTDKETPKKLDETLLINNNQLKIGFIDNNTNKKQYVTVFDDDITLSKKSADKSFLESYNITSNDDGIYTLDFTIKNNSDVTFVFNEEKRTYEIHLEKGKNSETTFERTFEKEEGEVLKIDFVNHIPNTSAKSDGNEVLIKKPVIIIDDAITD
ncbi:hypothetical protein LPB03_06350 [Polaribacter vadi]|uniref:Lipoprotein n=1 Tax=Polaribacter vadi TaxID=1774273 RepID=A0A1B8TZ83_9FLAO|nr:hypothetical protein [Polaribacter vadi]AOW17103.1 hypothetical protein LPB03_06350 [Polaribacter vadi]OBY64968.1 hypothetical protein LPB3_06135 [Polaribacter vadi]